jgi:hypothetical protein
MDFRFIAGALNDKDREESLIYRALLRNYHLNIGCLVIKVSIHRL